MCVRVQFSAHCPSDPWDAAARLITLPATLTDASTTRVVRAVLEELAIEQPPDGARCFCGEPIRLLPRVPEQRRSSEVISRGA
ncbi:hypothetical protein ADK33_03305 [Streptomyces griseus subsp. rhodochrous]|nr:hypothetical protein ADK33_03305 [Streptomyces griseus subsp. rhodochrous]